MPAERGRIMHIAEIIDRYVTEHPRAADTAKGIHGWWVASRHRAASPAEVQRALDLLVREERLARVALPDGTVLYARPAEGTPTRSQER